MANMLDCRHVPRRDIGLVGALAGCGAAPSTRTTIHVDDSALNRHFMSMIAPTTHPEMWPHVARAAAST